MTLLYRILAFTAMLLLLSAAICGWYIHTNRQVLTDYEGSLNFHMVVAGLGLVCTAAALFLKGR